MGVKVGILSVYWLPHFGGGEKYVYNLAKELHSLGVDVKGITPTPISEEKYNGDDELVVRLGEETQIKDFLGMRKWFDNHAKPHIIEEGYDIIILNNCRVNYEYFKDFINLLKREGIKCGIVHHDLGWKIVNKTFEFYEGDWELSKKKTLDYLNNMWDDIKKYDIITYTKFMHLLDSPIYFDPDFIIGNTEWSNTFIDIKEKTPKYVLHPIVEKPPNNPSPLAPVNITMLNPLYHKGRSYMVDLINDYNHKWTYRVLMGSYGNGKNTKDFMRLIADSWALNEERVDIVKYVEDIYSAYSSTDIFIFPSRYEGYGMAAVEPMLIGKPVIVQDYPSIVEAVGDGAYKIKWGSDSQEWFDAIEEILDDSEEIKQKSLKRGEFILTRQEEEIKGLIQFLEDLL
jgi:glycosyltransferase involved in cell wall biosynthesis